MWQQIGTGLQNDAGPDGPDGLALPRRGDRALPGSVPRQANGSLIVANGQAIGSELIGQNFKQARVLPAAALGGRQRRLRSDGFRRIESRPDQPEAGRPGEGFRGDRSARTTRITPGRFRPTC